MLYRACYLGSLSGVSKSVLVRLNGIEAVMVLDFENSEMASPATTCFGSFVASHLCLAVAAVARSDSREETLYFTWDTIIIRL